MKTTNILKINIQKQDKKQQLAYTLSKGTDNKDRMFTLSQMASRYIHTRNGNLVKNMVKWHPVYCSKRKTFCDFPSKAEDTSLVNRLV